MNRLGPEWQREAQWLEQIIEARLRGSKELLEPPALSGPLGVLIKRLGLNEEERMVLTLALAPELSPWVLEPLWGQVKTEQGELRRFGGIRGLSHGGFLPTGETVSALLSESFVFEVLAPWSPLLGSGAVILDEPPRGEPMLSGRLRCPRDLVLEVATGRRPDAEYSSDFPASRVITPRGWDDLILPPALKSKVAEVRDRILDSHQVWEAWGMREHHGEGTGLLVLFHGRPGTGKSLAASVLGKVCDRPVYRIDLSEVVSKYIGETEKNLARLFERAQAEDWILFFDEADSLFARRGEVREARDRYANQEVSYLLQRIEVFPGAVILATNKLGSIDEAFMRRIHVSLEFPEPDERCRYSIWQRVFPSDGRLPLSGEIDLRSIARDHDLTGAMIKNAALHAAFLAAARKRRKSNGHGPSIVVTESDILAGIRREQEKSGKSSVRSRALSGGGLTS